MSKKTKKPSMQPQRYLSDDIIFQILLKLPVDSLLRFICVSKSWKASIKSSSFISAHHHHHHINNKKSCSQYLVCKQNAFRDSVQNCTLIPDTSNGVPKQISLPRLWSKPWIAGSCEGLICLKADYIIYIWNPFTINLKRVPNGEIPMTLKSTCILGFGFAPKSGDYRVVKLLCEQDYLTEVEIYSLASDSWRKIKPLLRRIKPLLSIRRFHSYGHYGSGVCLEGSIYWPEIPCKTGRSNTILRFDLEEERIEEIVLPIIPSLILVRNGILVLLKHEIGKRVQAYTKKESELKSESSSWTVKSVDFTKIIKKMMRMSTNTTTEWMSWSTNSCIVLRGRDNSILACDCYYDGNDLSFKLRDLGINGLEWGSNIISIKKTLFFLDKARKRTRY